MGQLARLKAANPGLRVVLTGCSVREPDRAGLRRRYPAVDLFLRPDEEPELVDRLGLASAQAPVGPSARRADRRDDHGRPHDGRGRGPPGRAPGPARSGRGPSRAVRRSPPGCRSSTAATRPAPTASCRSAAGRSAAGRSTTSSTRPARWPPPAIARSRCSARTSTPTATTSPRSRASVTSTRSAGRAAGSTWPGRPDLAELIRAIDGLRTGDGTPAIGRLRFVTSHPWDLSDRLIAALADCTSVCEHLHLPVQSGSDAVLRRMGRQYTIEHYAERLARIREAVPGITVSTDIIVGFCGETEAQFEATLALLETVRYDQVFAAAYSPRPGHARRRTSPTTSRPTSSGAASTSCSRSRRGSASSATRRGSGREAAVLVDAIVPPRGHDHDDAAADRGSRAGRAVAVRPDPRQQAGPSRRPGRPRRPRGHGPDRARRPVRAAGRRSSGRDDRPAAHRRRGRRPRPARPPSRSTSPRRCARRGRTAEIISADSRQVFRGLDIGTAKVDGRGPRAGRRTTASTWSIRTSRSASRTSSPTPAGARRPRRRGGIAILAGGTGLYLRAIARGIDTAALPSDRAVRARLEAELDRRRAGTARRAPRGDRAPTLAADRRPPQPAAGRPGARDRRAAGRRSATTGARVRRARSPGSGSTWSRRHTRTRSRPAPAPSSTPGCWTRPAACASGSTPACRPSRRSATARPGRCSTAGSAATRRSSSTRSARSRSPGASERGSDPSRTSTWLPGPIDASERSSDRAASPRCSAADTKRPTRDADRSRLVRARRDAGR